MPKPENIEVFHLSLKKSEPLQGWPAGLKSMWWDVKGNWEASHNIAQDMSSQDGSWIHAYLHRKEGDRFNAEYWYRTANKSYPQISLEEEQKELVAHFIRK
ncbi:hypothetical protein OO010_06535 [Flavobacteriaceae bacterium KMM 6898]|nr:hypothetical protein [Flavobacteriaceae bacterium KMM 6898]